MTLILVKLDGSASEKVARSRQAAIAAHGIGFFLDENQGQPKVLRSLKLSAWKGPSMPETTASDWIAKVRRSWRAWRSSRALGIENELDRKPAWAFLLHLRTYISLIREIMSR